MPNEIAQKIAYTVRCAADLTIRFGDPKWCELVFATLPDQLSEGIKVVHIGAMSARVKMRGEVVRLHLHLNDSVSVAIIRDAIRMALEPFVVRGRQLIVHDALEGLVFVFVLANDRQIQAIHKASAKDDLARIAPHSPSVMPGLSSSASAKTASQCKKNQA
jgi:hypothetical protein